MVSLDKRIGALESLIQSSASPEDEAAASRRALAREILEEFARLKASCAVHTRGGERIEPEDIPGKILGSGYSTEDLWELARRRVLERGRS